MKRGAAMPPSLAELQRDFAAALRDPERAPPAGLRRADGRPETRRFDVHRNNRMAALIETLEAAFPAVARLVGPAFFRAAAKAYIAAHPPRGPVLLLYGARFGDFLDGFEPAAGVPYLGDVARLEWAWLAAYHAADAEPVPLDRLGALPAAAQATARLTLHPSLTLLRARFPVASLRDAVLGAGDPDGVDMARGEDVAVLRPDLSVRVRVLPPGGYAFATALAAGRDLGTAAAEAADAAPDFDLAAHLAGLFDLGAVAAVHAAADPPAHGPRPGPESRKGDRR